jgi:hypothetical protein
MTKTGNTPETATLTDGRTVTGYVTRYYNGRTRRMEIQCIHVDGGIILSTMIAAIV